MEFIDPVAVKVVIWTSIFVYFAHDFFERRRIKDEREELIRLKAFESLQKMMMVALPVASVVVTFRPEISAIWPVLFLILVSMYGEISAKIYYRWKF